MYEQAFNAILNKAPNLKPNHIITDFEIGAINAAKMVFSTTKMHGCFFHFCQSIWRKIQQIGLQARYSEDSTFALNIRQIMALAFIPVDDIKETFRLMCASSFWSENEEDDDVDEDSQKIQELLNYFETTYIGIDTHTQSRRRRSIFAPELWSVFEATKQGKK